MINYIETLGAILLTIVIVFMICVMAGGIIERPAIEVIACPLIFRLTDLKVK